MKNLERMSKVGQQMQDNQLQLLFKSLPGVAMVFDRDMRCLASNKNSVENFTGLDTSFLEGRMLSDLLIDEESKNNIISKFELCSELQLEQQLETKPAGLDNNHSLVTTVVPFEGGDVKDGFLSYCQLIKVAKATSAANTEQLKLLNDNALLLNSEGVIIYANRGYMGRTVQALQGQCVTDLFTGDDRMMMRAVLMRVAEDTISLCFENHVVVSGTPRWYSHTVSPFDIEDNKTKSVLLLSREISGLKSKIWQLDRENRLQDSVLNNITDGVLAIDTKGKITIQNPVTRMLFGGYLRTVDDLNSKENSRITDSRTGQEMSYDDLALIRALNGESVDLQECLLVNNRFPEGRILHFTARPLNSESEITGAVMVIRDVTLSRKSQLKLEQANENLDNFVKAVAHDLKSPVDNMRNLFTLYEHTDAGEKKTEVLDKVKQSVHKLGDLLEALMELVNAQKDDNAGVDVLNFQETLNFTLDGLAEPIVESGAQITSDFTLCPEITFNKAYLRSIIYNLMSNAIKYRDEKRPLNIHVKVSELQANRVLLSVVDNGIGIDMNRYGQELFKPFRRLTSRGEGKGVGLNLVKHFVERNGGEINVQSTKGVGSTFEITLVPHAQI